MMRMESILWYFILYVIHKYVYKKIGVGLITALSAVVLEIPPI